MKHCPFLVSLLILLFATAGCSDDNASKGGDTGSRDAGTPTASATGGSCQAYAAAV